MAAGTWRCALRLALVSEQLGGDPDGAPRRGVIRHVAELARALAGAGHEVRVYTRIGQVDRGQQLAPGVPVEPLSVGPAGQLPDQELRPVADAFAERLAGRWRAGWRPEVVHAHHWLSGLAALEAGRVERVPVAVSYHELDPAGEGRRGAGDGGGRRELERQLGAAVDLVIGQTRAELGELARLGVARGRISLVPTGVDPGCFAPIGPLAPRRPLPRRILAVGSPQQLPPRKNLVDIVAALRYVPDAELMVVGGPPRSGLAADPQVFALRQAARECGVADRVWFTGQVPREEMPRWYRSADVLACASSYEPFGVAAIEAMGCGIPVVATAVGALQDAVVDGVTGVLVAPHQPAQLGRALRRVLADQLRRLEYAAAGLDRARHCYAWERVADRMGTQYRRLAGPRS